MSGRSLTICAVGYGQSTHVAARTRCFAERGHRVYLITEVRSASGIQGVTELVPELPSGSLSSLMLRGLLALLRAMRIDAGHVSRIIAFIALLRRYRPDIVHVHFAYAYYAWIAGLVGCRPLVVTVMGGDVLFEEQGTPTREGKWLTLNLLRRADYITSKSDHLIGVLDQLGGFGAKAERVVWGIPLRTFHRVNSASLREQLGLRPLQRVVLSPKILQPFYRIHLIVEAMARVVKRFPDALLLVTEYGADPEYRAKLGESVQTLGLGGHVRFCGRIAYDNMPAYYSLAEMTVAVPSSDGLPQTLLEGMACETPSILCRLPRYEEIVTHRESACFVDPDPDSIAAGIVDLLSSPELCKVIARNALAIVRTTADLDEQAARVERRFYELARTVPARSWSPIGAWRAWRAYRKVGRVAGV